MGIQAEEGISFGLDPSGRIPPKDFGERERKLPMKFKCLAEGLIERTIRICGEATGTRTQAIHGRKFPKEVETMA
jgi:hypothetical protein